MALHVIVGAGPVGTATARLLAERGERVRVVTRRGTGPEHQAIERVAADAADADRLAALTEGADALYNCANPEYHRWRTDWPPLAAALLTAVERSGAVLTTVGNLYGYGPVDAPMTEATPLAATGVKGRVRNRMWADALAAHRAGRARVTEVRGSDYIGLGGNSLPMMVLPKVLAGQRVFLPVAWDAPHTWTYVGDVARTLVAAATDPRAWGRAWHVPSAPPMSMRALADRAAKRAGAPAPRLIRMPYPVLWLGGLADPFARELRETAHQFAGPFVMDSTAASETFGIEGTPLDRVVDEMVTGLRAAAPAAAR
ncbi:MULTISPECIES: NAD-dependent epimerase/dehydratase family protein [unclassified Micromonospora]|uniref:NAD-dependent epimerase/dehydratase family protein n=1 Tax=unclassified Micromonospora TaxID=2617518 RepID=UPI0022B712FF|nr:MULTISPECIES: NAD-dependent epimerase/dehydratase family protein [unclassified Micromonospora]MCZ7473244.1 NAD-dependent epimerase/dehydratase family protein [Micromonospora sp. WMMC273]WBC03910.1 NAD-dependent epimerase/dehydratase family protein [Micromonospora sp. WMMA1976]